MNRPYSAALLAGLASLLVFASGARAGVTIDLIFHDVSYPSGITILDHDPGPGCTFDGYYHHTVTTGRCMDVMLYTTDPLIAVASDVAYDTHNDLAVQSFYEWNGVGVSFDNGGAVVKTCAPAGGLVDNGAILQSFDCTIPEPNNPPVLAAGTYKIGTIVWDTSGFVTLGRPSWVSWVSVADAIVGAVINGNIVDVSSTVVLGSHSIAFIPEPGTAALLGLGLVCITLAARRRRG